MKNRNNAGAIASNAGDDFHLLWACRKILQTLNSDTNLTAVSVEGASWYDSVDGTDGEKLYSIDLAEYYGGNNFLQADSVIFSQLKYSTFQMGKDWTLSELCTNTNKEKNKNNSIIRRLADTYDKYCDEFTAVNDKLTIKFVSNRNLSPDVAKHIKDCQKLLFKKKYQKTVNLLNILDNECRNDIQKIYVTSNLSSSRFLGFLQVLNFEDCGTSIRSIHKTEIIRQIGHWNISNVKNGYHDLIMHIREMMLPEQVKGFPMEKEYVLSVLGTTNYQMFPAPSEINKPLKEYIKRDVEESFIAKYFGEESEPVICIQATAGAGKTTFVSNLGDYLPEASVTVFYDCYGGGSYLFPAEHRHLPDVAIPQICNTLAVECGTDLLIGRPFKEYEWWRFLNDRLKNAVNYVKEQNPQAVVVIIIDAADNSMIAADTFKEECFLQGILNQPFPKGVFLVVTTRTERKKSIPFGKGVVEIPFPEFALNESSRHLKSVFPDVTEKECEEFHLLSRNNPRIQTYMLSEAKSVQEMLEKVKPIGKTVDMLFDGFLEESDKQYNSLTDISVLFSGLVSLPRPIPVKILCEICNISEDMLKSISIECRLGFYVSGDKVLFRDEDFETYLRSKYGENDKAINQIADYFYNNRTKESYCVGYLHIFLDKSNRFHELLEISLNEILEASAFGVVQTNRIMRERIRYTLKRKEIFRQENRLYACKLIYKLIDFNAKDDMLKELLFDIPDACVLYSDELSIYNVFHTDTDSFEGMSKAALVFSQLPSYKEDAEQYLKNYFAAVDVYYNKPDDDRDNIFRPRTSDIVRIAETLLWLDKREEAIRWLCGWEPRKAATKHIYRLYKKLLKYDFVELYESLLLHQWSGPDTLAIVAAYLSLGKEPPQIYLEKLLKLFCRMSKVPEDRFDMGQLLTFLEYVIGIQKGMEIVSELINKFELEIAFSGMPSFYREDEQNDLSLRLRYYTLKAICSGKKMDSEDFWKERAPLETEIVSKKRNSENHKSLVKMIEFLFPIYLFRIECMRGAAREELLERGRDVLVKMERSLWRIGSFEHQKLLEMGVLVFTESVCLSLNFDSADIKGLMMKALRLAHTSPQFKLNLLKRMIYNKKAFDSALIILDKIESAYEEYPASAKEMAEVYFGCAESGCLIDKKIGKKYFDKAIECTKESDYEAYRKIHLYKTLADKLRGEQGDYVVVAHNMIRLSEDFCRKMGDTKNFPYEEALSSAALLDTKSIWAALSRLDDRDKYDGFSLQETLPIVLDILNKEGGISVENVVALLGLALPDISHQYNKIVDVVIERLRNMEPDKQKPLLELLIWDILYAIPMDEKRQRSHHMVEYLNSVVVSPELDSARIREMDHFLQQQGQAEKDQFYSKQNKGENKKRNIKQYVSNSATVSPEILKEQLDRLGSDEKISFVKEWLGKLSQEQYVDAFVCVLELLSKNDYRYNVEKILNVLAKFIDSVHLWPQVEEWRNDKENQKYFIRIFAKELLYLYNGNDEIYQLLIKIFSIDKSTVCNAFIEYISEHINCADEQLVMALCKMAIALSSKESYDFLKWCFDMELTRVHPSSGDDKNFQPVSTDVENVDEGIAYFIWRMLGHPDKGLRCKASHVLLRLYHMGDIGKIVKISKFCKLPLISGYIDKDNYFFHDSAQLWYFVACLRIAKSSPESLKSMYAFFREIACAKDIIHALHRKICKNICLELLPAWDEDDREQLAVCDQCLEMHTKGLPQYEREYSERKDNWKFDFDTMDTLRYWYDDLAELFSCSQTEVATDCDYYIAKLGISNEMTRKWGGKYLSNKDYAKTSNSHGSIPTVETLEKYAEWHSMFYVADQYRREKNPAQNSYQPYEDWIENRLAGNKGFWCFEFRNHVPLIPFLWEYKKFIKGEKEQKYFIPDGLMDLIVDTDLGISLHMEYNAYFEQSVQYINIQSVLCGEESINKLIAEMRKPHKELWEFYYQEDDEYYVQSELHVIPTCDVIMKFSDYALDQKDLLLKDFLYTVDLIGLSVELEEYLSITHDEQIECARIYDSRNMPIQIYHWSEPENESGYEKRSTYGNLVAIKKDSLMDVLETEKQVLVMEISITFKDNDHQFYGTASQPIKERLLYIFDQNGNKRTVTLSTE